MGSGVRFFDTGSAFAVHSFDTRPGFAFIRRFAGFCVVHVRGT